MLRFLLLLGSAALAASAQELVPLAPLPSPAEIDAAMRGLSGITGFRVHKRLPFARVTRDEVNRFLREEIRRSVRPQELHAEEVTLRKFGFVSADFDLKKTTINLLTEQAAAFYDFHRKKLFISDWASRNMRETAIVHELAHALADQNFPIQKYLGGAGDDSEASAAREAVVEGQASWLMVELAARSQGKSLKDTDTARELLRDSPEAEGEEFPVFSKAPLYLRRTLMFPYEEGERFQQAVFLKDGPAGFAEVFGRPPVSTSQVIHPERYFAKVTFPAPELPAPLRHSRPFVTGAMGELDHRILLEQFLDLNTAETLGPKMRGAAYRIDEAKPDRRLMLVYASDWETEAAAQEFFADYIRILRAKWQRLEGVTEQPGRFSGRSEDGYFALERKGTRVVSREGFAQAL